MPVEKEVHHRARMNTSKVDHFIEYVNRPHFYQDVSFGTRKLKVVFQFRVFHTYVHARKV